MTPQQLENGNKIAEELKRLLQHRDAMIYISENLKSWQLELRKDSNGDRYQIKHEYVPLGVDGWLTLYVARLNKEIAELEKQFEEI